MHATVGTFDPETHAGTILFDDGVELPFDAAAFEAGGLRTLRLGQRVQLVRDADGRVLALTLATLPPLALPAPPYQEDPLST